MTTEETYLAWMRYALWGGTPPADPADENVLAIANRQKTRGLVFEAVLRSGAVLPEATAASMKQLLLRLLSTHRMLDAAVAKTMGALQQEGIPAVLLKGQGAARNYPGPELRECGDIDIYIGPERLEEAVRALTPLADKVDALEKENAALKNKVASLEKELDNYKKLLTDGQTYLYENGQFTAVDAKAGAPVTVYFDCGSAAVSAREKAHLEYFAENVVNADTKLVVNGYADKQTGSAKRNQQLSEQRVKAVVDLLKKAGASEANIEANALGATVQPFNSPAKNRVVTVEVK